MTTNSTRRFFAVLLGLGVFLCADLPANAQASSLIPKGMYAWSKTAVVPVIRPSMPLKGVRVSAALGSRAHRLLQNNAALGDLIAPQVQRQVFSQQVKRGYLPGYYQPTHVDTNDILYLQQVQKELNALYPQTKRRFAPFTADTLKQVVQVWQKAPADENFMSATAAVEVLVSRTASRRTGYYALAVESTAGSERAVHDVLILDVNNARWISLRKSLSAAHPLRQPKNP